MKNTTPHQLEMRILLFVDDGAWVAQCLEIDIAEHGASIDEAMQNWARAFIGHILADASDGSASNMPIMESAPPEFVRRWHSAKMLTDKRQISPPDDRSSVPPAWMIPAIENELRRPHR